MSLSRLLSINLLVLAILSTLAGFAVLKGQRLGAIFFLLYAVITFLGSGLYVLCFILAALQQK